MTKKIYFKAIPFDKKLVTLALESGVDGILAQKEDLDKITALGRTQALDIEDFKFTSVQSKEDEESVVQSLKSGEKVVLSRDAEIIPVENIVAQAQGVGKEVATPEEVGTAMGILERGVDFVVADAQGAQELKKMVSMVKQEHGTLDLLPGTITEITPLGLGHRVCVDTISLLDKGQGMLVGNSNAFTFLVNAETESNPYVAPRPFRINAGAVHSYACQPGDRTTYLEELAPGKEVLIASPQGEAKSAVVGRVKTEVRPMLLISAEYEGHRGSVIVQNAETIRLIGADKNPVSVVQLRVGDQVLCRSDQAGRHFGMRVQEDIREK